MLPTYTKEKKKEAYFKLSYWIVIIILGLLMYLECIAVCEYLDKIYCCCKIGQNSQFLVLPKSLF